MTEDDLLHRCELCGVIVANPPEDPSDDRLCPECTDHLADAAVRLLGRAAARVRELGSAAETDGWTVDGTTVFEDDHGVCARTCFAEDAEWIAMASPVIAEPLAVWLEWAATPPEEAIRHVSALNVARALLGVPVPS